MNIPQLFELASKLGPLMPRLEKAVATAQRLQGDPDVQDAIAVAKEAIVIVENALGSAPQSS